LSTEANTTPSPSGGRLLTPKLEAYMRLAKLDIWDYYLGLLVVLSLLPSAVRLDGKILLTLVVFLISELFVVFACVSFDDITGYRDGSDARNYGPDAPARKLRRKPLLDGRLTEAEALRFAWWSTAAAVVTTALAFAIAPHTPAWAVALVIVSHATFIQYSWGLKFSYIGMSEVVLAGVAFGWLLGPYGLVAGTAPGFVVVQAIVFGLGPMLFGVYSNTNDIEGDRSVNRRTMATVLSPRGNALFVATMSALEALVIVGSSVAGIAPWWFALAMAPVLAMRTTQWVLGFRRGRILDARKLGIRTHRVAVLIFIVVNLAHPL